MPRSGRRCWQLVVFALAYVLACGRAPAATPEPALQFRITEGNVLNAFYQQGPVAAHLLLSNGTQPRVLVAFPAGNSGVGLWFEPTSADVHWTLNGIERVSRPDDRGRMLHGIVADITVDRPLVVHDAVLSSIRVLRDYQIQRTYPPEVRASAEISADAVEWTRPRLDRAAGYALSIALADGRITRGEGAALMLSPVRGGQPLHMQVMALTGEKPLTPLGATRLFNTQAAGDERSRQVLAFLSYEEKYLAGSWRFDTYFGRDTLMSLRLLMPVLQPEAIERGLMSVLQRLSPRGEVAHEEDIGEFALLRHRRQGDAASDAPIYDYKMIDDDFMLAAVTAAYLFEHPQGRARVEAFLSQRLPDGERVGAALVRNFLWVADSARAFAQSPTPANLISLKPGTNVGNWRDSENGLAGGRYPYDVNAVLVPAALQAIGRVMHANLLKSWLDASQTTHLAGAANMANVWLGQAPALFRVRLSHETARRSIATYAAAIGVDARAAIASLPARELVVNAIALDAAHRPIAVLNSDGGFALLLLDPVAADVEQLVDTMLRPFPAGLLTDAGLLVANPAFTDEQRQRQLDRSAYHGTVVWSWQQAMLAAALERQLARRDLPPTLVERLREGQRRLWSAIANAAELRSSELWSWRFAGGRYRPVPFGQGQADADESNAAQLWSTVYLAIAPPE